jgi:hypothetical protein
MDISQYIGVTESGEVAFDLSVFDRLYLGNIIITKRLSDALIDKLVEHQDSVILHLTCTGYGGTVVEPLVPTVEQTHGKFLKLIEKGFPIEHVVLRIDPIIPTPKGIQTALSVIKAFMNDGILRVRFSMMDMYEHVMERFNNQRIPMPYSKFHADYKSRMRVVNVMKYCSFFFGFDIEACAEPSVESIPCLSYKDIDILGLKGIVKLEGRSEQRKNCHCPSNKKELLVGLPSRCKHKCLYCFWRD